MPVSSSDKSKSKTTESKGNSKSKSSRKSGSKSDHSYSDKRDAAFHTMIEHAAISSPNKTKPIVQLATASKHIHTIVKNLPKHDPIKENIKKLKGQYIVMESPMGYLNDIDAHEVFYCPNYKSVRNHVINRIEEYINDDGIDWGIDENELQKMDEDDLFQQAIGLGEVLAERNRDGDYGITCIIKIFGDNKLKFYGKVHKYKNM